MVKLKFPCKLCKKSCKSNQKCINCDICNEWMHLKCTSLSLAQFLEYSDDSLLPFYCIPCLSENLPLNCLPSCYAGPTQDGKGYLPVDNLELHFEKSNYLSEDLVILHINTRSLTKNVDLISELLVSFNVKPDLIAITETKLNKKSSIDLVQITGYKFLHNDSFTAAGGTALYIKCSINFIPRQDILFHSTEFESTWIEIENNRNKLKNILIGVIYRHPQNNINDFTDNLSNLLHKISLENKTICLTGDFNIDALKMNTKNNIGNYFNNLYSFGFKNDVDLPTRITPTSTTLIDHFYHNTHEHDIFTSVICSDITDHFPLLISVKNSITPIKQNTCYKRNYRMLNHDKFKSDLSFMIHNLNNANSRNDNINDKFENF